MPSTASNAPASTIASRQSRYPGAFLLLLIATVGLSAFLLFLVQPLIGKYMLPWFGGSPAVWTTCLVFFQTLLLLGYAYAHLLLRWLPLRLGAGVHVLLLLSAILLLPITPAVSAKPLSPDHPGAKVFVLLLRTVGVPFLLLSTTGPLTQAWMSRLRPTASAYRLYALSNAGSFAALIAYPLIVERLLTRHQQTVAWSVGFLCFVAACATTALTVIQSSGTTARQTSRSAGTTEPLNPLQIGLWFALPCCASLLLVSITATLTEDVAVIPLLWVIPLGLYLLTFVICFEKPTWYVRPAALIGCALSAILICLLRVTWGVQILPQLIIFCGGLFALCYACHGELERLKPAPDRLTLFYLLIAAGGATGGAFVSIVAPVIFKTHLELPLGLIGATSLCAVCFGLMPTHARRMSQPNPRANRWWWAAACPLAVLVSVALTFLVQQEPAETRIVERDRNFYGVLTVKAVDFDDPGQARLELFHGKVKHGQQFVSSTLPTMYYAPGSGVGLTLLAFHPDRPKRVGLVGMGVGTLASYGRPGDSFRFYEIDPNVMLIANNRFTFLSRSRANVAVVPGDARLTLEREPPQKFDVLVLDAFRGDAIPIHLLTVECFELYLRHLNQNGIIALHTSNDYLDLYPVLLKIADRLGLRTAYIIDDNRNPTPGSVRSEWLLLSRDREFLDSPPIAAKTFTRSDVVLNNVRLWTDEDSNLLEIMRTDFSWEDISVR